MGRFILVLLVLLIAFGIYRSWFVVSSKNDPVTDKVNTTFTVDKAKIKEDTAKAEEKVSELGESAKIKAHQISDKVTSEKEKTEKPALYALQSASLDLAPGGKATVQVKRTDPDISKPVQLGLTASEGSHLQVSGGQFASGQSEANVMVEAPLNAQDGSIFISPEGNAAMELKVHIKASL